MIGNTVFAKGAEINGNITQEGFVKPVTKKI